MELDQQALQQNMQLQMKAAAGALLRIRGALVASAIETWPGGADGDRDFHLGARRRS